MAHTSRLKTVQLGNSEIDRVDTSLWLAITNVTVIVSPVGQFRYELINTEDGEKASARYLGKK